MTREEAFAEINNIQNQYIDELIAIMNNPNYDVMKMIDFTSPTGTGKTKMMSKLINKLPDCYFIITTLSKGQLHFQIRANLKKDCNQDNFDVYGSADYRINSKLEADDIISKIPEGVKCIWLRDEGHIKTNRFDELLLDVCYKVINFSATNIHSDVQCNFASTMMLRTVNQTNGTPEDAIFKLLEIKKAHKNVSHYNPCAIFRCVCGDNILYDRITALCNKYNLKYIDITEESFIMSELCEDDNEYDVIINKFKIVEGIDIRRAHVLYMDNQPNNNATTIQVIGRCRRNALLYRNDIDILDPNNYELLVATRECYVYYNVEKMKISTDADGELQYTFCDYISCESLKTNSQIYVENGQLANGLYVLELLGLTGTFNVIKDVATGFNIVDPVTSFYDKNSLYQDNDYVYLKLMPENYYSNYFYKKIHVNDIKKLNIQTKRQMFNFAIGTYVDEDVEPYYDINNLCKIKTNVKCNISKKCFKIFKKQLKNYTQEYIYNNIKCKCLDYKSHNEMLNYKLSDMEHFVNIYVKQHPGYKIWFDDIIKNTCDNIFCYYDGRYKLSNELCIILEYYCINKELNKIDREYIQNYIIQPFIHAIAILKHDDHTAYTTVEYNRIAIMLLNETELPRVRSEYHCVALDVKTIIPGASLDITIDDVNSIFRKCDDMIINIIESNVWYSSAAYLSSIIWQELNRIYQYLKHGILSIVVVCDPILKDVPKSDYIKCINCRSGKLSINDVPKYKSYTKILNDVESAIIGVDLMHQIKDKKTDVIKWYESKAVTSKVNNYNKLNSFITNTYKNELFYGKKQCFTGKNNFELNAKCNSSIGYCVEYYSKYLVYGEGYLGKFIKKAQSESKTDIINDNIIIRACMLKYKEMMINSFGLSMSKIIRLISVDQLIKDEYKYFVKLVVELGTKTAEFVKNVLYQNNIAVEDIDPNLSIQHITGLADYITSDTIIDIKVRNNIDVACVKQVLGYYYLSTKRSDLNIKRVIIYDAVSGRYVDIPVNNCPEVSDEDLQKLIDQSKTKANQKANMVKRSKFNIKSKRAKLTNEEKTICIGQRKLQKKQEYIGVTNKMNCGLMATCIDYNGCKDLTIRFEDGLIRNHVRSDKFMEGKVAHIEN